MCTQTRLSVGSWYLALPKSLFVLTLFATPLLGAEVLPGRPEAMPDDSGQLMLILNTLTLVNHANLSGNYTVLRDLTSESFRQQNTSAGLAVAFAELRGQGFDLSPVLITEPKLTQRPGLDQHGRMRLVGYFPTQPQAVWFDLLFQSSEGTWGIDGISVRIAPIETTARTQRMPQP